MIVYFFSRPKKIIITHTKMGLKQKKHRDGCVQFFFFLPSLSMFIIIYVFIFLKQTKIKNDKICFDQKIYKYVQP